MVQAKDLEYGVKSLGKNVCICKRYTENELINRVNCSGTLNKNYLAVSREQAGSFPNLAKRHHLRLQEKKHNQPHLSTSRQGFSSKLWKILQKRHQNRAEDVQKKENGEFQSPFRHDDDDSIGYGEMKVKTENCLARWSIDGNKKRACGVCPTLTRQPQSPRRFPEYLNGLICHPSEDSEVSLSGTVIGTCVQETITMEIVEWKGEWEEDASLTQQNGITTYVEKWDPYEQEINSTCSFSFYQF